jgi:signal peptidase I
MTALVTALTVTALILTALILTVYVRQRLVVVTIAGISMEPTFVEGDRVLVRRSRLAKVRRGAVIVLADPEAKELWIIKRAAALPGDPVPRAEFPALAGATETHVPPDRIVIRADNPAGADSRLWGYYDGHSLLGVAISRMSRGSG